MDPLEDAFLGLRREYLSEAPARLAELWKDADAFAAGEPDAAASLQMRFHRLAGSGGSYGFPEISVAAREAEQWIATGRGPSDVAELRQAVERIAESFDQAAADLGAPESARPVRAPGFGAEAVLLVSRAELRDRLADRLRTVGFRVRLLPLSADPFNAPSERPDLLVIAPEPGDGDPAAIAVAWTADPAYRPRAVVLAETGRAVDRLRAVAAGIDAIIGDEDLEGDVVRYARSLARVGGPPASVLVVEEEDGGIAAELEQASLQVRVVRRIAAAPELLERSSPDLLIIHARNLDPEALALVRLVRQDPRWQILPVIGVSPDRTVATQIEAERAGIDQLLPSPPDPKLLLQAVVSRAERGRRLRESTHRDDLTGLLNYPTLMAELESAVAYSRRHGGPVAFAVFDLDHFRRVNDQYGHQTGDRVLAHVAALMRNGVRASDLLGRYGGEEIGLVLRGSAGQGAVMLAAKLRKLVAGHPATARDGTLITVSMSVGCASFPGDGETAADLARAADRALARAKAGGRDRVETGEQ